MKTKKFFSLLIALTFITCFNPLAEAAKPVKPPASLKILSVENDGQYVFITGEGLCNTDGTLPIVKIAGDDTLETECVSGSPDELTTGVLDLNTGKIMLHEPGTYLIEVTNKAGVGQFYYSPMPALRAQHVYRKGTYRWSTVDDVVTTVAYCDAGDFAVAGGCIASSGDALQQNNTKLYSPLPRTPAEWAHVCTANDASANSYVKVTAWVYCIDTAMPPH